MAKPEADETGIGFEDTLWATADKLRGTVNAAEHKHVVLGLLFLKYVSDISFKGDRIPRARRAARLPASEAADRRGADGRGGEDDRGGRAIQWLNPAIPQEVVSQ